MLQQIVVPYECFTAAIDWAGKPFRIRDVPFSHVAPHVTWQVDELALQNLSTDRASHRSFPTIGRVGALIDLQ